MSENDLWNMVSREDQEVNGRAWSLNTVKPLEAVLLADICRQSNETSGCRP
jgi:hypothetical protein